MEKSGVLFDFILASGVEDKYNDSALHLVLSFICGPLAQLVEQLTLNQRVEGSTPSRLTIKKLREQWAAGSVIIRTASRPLLSLFMQREWRNWQTRWS